jgi:hypothetical protein
MKEAESTGTILVSVHLSRIVSCGFAWVCMRERSSNAERHRKLARMAALMSIMKEAESTGTILVCIHCYCTYISKCVVHVGCCERATLSDTENWLGWPRSNLSWRKLKVPGPV